jgi:uncharacterized protein (TIGR02453 family)
VIHDGYLTTEYNGEMATKTPARVASEFLGFNDEAFRFLKGLAKNNDRDWFLPRKSAFEDQLQQPMTQLILAVEAEMKKNKVPLLTKPKAMLSRIYRDIRFSADKSPYHTFVSGTLHRNGNKTAPGALYVHVGNKEQFAAIGFWQPERPVLTNWRLRMQEDPQEFLKMAKRLGSKKLAMDTTHRLQRMPRGFETAEGKPIGEYLRFQSFVIMRPLTMAEVTSAKLPHLVAQFALDARPLLDYGWAVPNEKPTVFLD